VPNPQGGNGIVRAGVRQRASRPRGEGGEVMPEKIPSMSTMPLWAEPIARLPQPEDDSVIPMWVWAAQPNKEPTPE